MWVTYSGLRMSVVEKTTHLTSTAKLESVMLSYVLVLDDMLNVRWNETLVGKKNGHEQLQLVQNNIAVKQHSMMIGCLECQMATRLSR